MTTATVSEVPWVESLRAPGPERELALGRLHDLLLRAARFEIGRRRAQPQARSESAELMGALGEAIAGSARPALRCADADAAVPGMRAHLDGCPACNEDHASLFALVADDQT